MIRQVWSLALFAAVVPGLSMAVEPLPRPGWYVGTGLGMVAPEGGREGYTRSLQLGYRSGYQSPSTPRSYVSLEFSLADSIRQVRPDHRRSTTADVLLVGAHLAGNSHLSERMFLRSRLGMIYRQVDRGGGDRDRQGRLSFGLGAGVRLGERTEAVLDGGVQYLGVSARLYYTATTSLRFHF